MAKSKRQNREESAFLGRHWRVSGAIAIACCAVGLAAWLRPGWFNPPGRPWISLLAMAGCFVFAIRMGFPALSGWSQWRKKQSLATQRWTAKSLMSMSWREFETLTALAFERQGWTVEQTGLGGADGGVDVMLRRRGVKALGQCKRHANPVGVKVAREILGEMHARGFHQAYVIAASGFTRDALAFAETCKKSGNAIQLIDGTGLVKMLGGSPEAIDLDQARREQKAKRKAAPGDEAAIAAAEQEAEALARKPAPRMGGQPPQCPHCRQAMRPARAKSGPSAGQWFWGCSGWPRCRGARPDDGRILAWASKREARAGQPAAPAQARARQA